MKKKLVIFPKGRETVMAALEKLVRAFEAVKLSQGNPSGGGSSVPGGGSQGYEQRPQEHTSTMASLASSLSQQSQGLLRYVHCCGSSYGSSLFSLYIFNLSIFILFFV